MTSGPCINNRRNFIVNSVLNFDGADFFCRNLGGDLASFESVDEYDSVSGIGVIMEITEMMSSKDLPLLTVQV